MCKGWLKSARKYSTSWVWVGCTFKWVGDRSKGDINWRVAYSISFVVPQITAGHPWYEEAGRVTWRRRYVVAEIYHRVQCLKKKWSLPKYYYWRYFVPICLIPLNLLHLHRMSGHVKALQDMFWRRYSVAYSPYKFYNRK